MSMDTEDRMGDGVDVSASRARQAYPGRRILWILSISLVLVLGALFGTMALYSGQLSAANGPGPDRQAAGAFDGPVVEVR